MRNESGAGRVTTPTSANTPQQASTADTDRSATIAVVVAFATRMVAAGGARRDWLVVRQCPLCGYPHRHVAFEADPQTVVERAPSCAPWRRYVVRIVDVVPPRRRARRAAA